MPYIPTEEVESSNIERIGYHRQQQILRIIFHGEPEGRAYDYPMVTEREYDALMAADSKGRFFNSRIKPMYAHRTPRPVELVEPCCDHDEPNPTCTKECFPCNEWCCPGAPSSASQEEIAAAVADGLRFGAADHNAASPTTGSEEDEKVCLHPDREENLDGSGVVCGVCGADLSQSGDCPHGADGRTCETGCGCIPCHQPIVAGTDEGIVKSIDNGATWESVAAPITDACEEHPDGCPDDVAHYAPNTPCRPPVDIDENPEEETNGNPD